MQYVVCGLKLCSVNFLFLAHIQVKQVDHWNIYHQYTLPHDDTEWVKISCIFQEYLNFLLAIFSFYRSLLLLFLNKLSIMMKSFN